jgi:surfeit locus 1 family protein
MTASARDLARRLTRRDRAFVLLALVMGAACIRLGFWQLSRLAERRASNGLIAERMALPDLDLAGAAGSTDDLAFRMAEGQGDWDPTHEFVLANRSLGGLPGAHLVTPFRPDGSDLSILIDRGWISQETSSESARQGYRNEASVHVRGLLKPSQEEPTWAFLADPTMIPGGPPRQSWRVLYIPGIQQQTPYVLSRYFLELTEAPGAGLDPDPDPDIDLSEGPHLAYAIQWFAFSAIALGGIGVWIWKRPRPEA